jgi:hypothetical protein
MGHIKPKTVSELMDVASKFADREDAYHNKRTQSPKDDRSHGTVIRGADLATTITIALIAK